MDWKVRGRFDCLRKKTLAKNINFIVFLGSVFLRTVLWAFVSEGVFCVCSIYLRVLLLSRLMDHVFFFFGFMCR